MSNRREFLTLAASVAAASTLRPARADDAPAKLLWGNLLHLGMNMWCDREVQQWGGLKGEELKFVTAQAYLRCDQTLWNDLTQRMADVGMNLLVIDLGEGLRYPSHPELAVRNSWTPERMRNELDRLRLMGLEPIPKLNFSTAHDAWLGPYSRCVSTASYYQVCEDVIADVVRIFDRPRFFHLGYDEETAEHQREYNYAVVRQHELWWHDFLFLVRQVEQSGSRAWIWADYGWRHKDEFFEKMPKTVLQSNWYYGLAFEGKPDRAAQHYLDLEAAGYDQIPTGSSWSTPENFKATVAFCRKNIAPSRLKGFLQTPWKPTLEICRKYHMDAIDQVAQAMKV